MRRASRTFSTSISDRGTRLNCTSACLPTKERDQSPVQQAFCTCQQKKFVWLLVAASLLWPCVAGAQLRQTKRVLILNAFAPTLAPRIAILNRAIVASLESTPYQIELYIEDMDSLLFPDQIHQREFRRWYTQKYRDRNLDLVVAVGLEPLRFMVESHEKAFSGTPIVFCGITEEMYRQLRLDARFTGVWSKVEPEKTLLAALHLQPGTRRVVVVGGTGVYDRYLEELVRKAFRDYESSLEIGYFTDMDMPTLLARVKQLPSHTIIYDLPFTQDARGARFHDSSQAFPRIAAAANAPMFVVSDADIGSGAIGGNLLSFADVGQIAADMAVRILQGEKPQNIPIVQSANVYMFDATAMQRWGLDELNLPPGSILLNRRVGAWESYRWYIIGTVGLILVEGLLVFGLVWQMRRRGRAEHGLEIAHERLRLAVEGGKSVGWEWDVKGGRETWFGDLQTVFGIASESQAGRAEDFHRRVHPDDRQLVSKAIAEARHNRTPYFAEFRVIRDDGAVRWLNARGQFYYTSDGESERMLGMAVDISERKGMEEALRKSEEKFSKAFRHGPMALTLTSAKDHRYIEVNDSFTEITGWQREEVIGRTPFDLGIWVDPAQRTEVVNRVLEGGMVRNLEIRFRCKDGTQRTGLGSADLIAIGDEPCLLSVITDITERRAMQDKLHQSEERLRGVVDSAMDAIITCDDDKRIVLFNPAAERMFGYSSGEVMERTLDRFIPQRFRTVHQEHMSRYGASGISNRGMGSREPLWGVRANGEEFPMEASISQVEVGGKKLFTAIIRDISARLGLEEAQRKSEQRLHLAVQAGKMYAYEWNVDSNTIVRSPEYADVIGADQPMVESRERMLTRVHPDDRKRFETLVAGITPKNPSSQITYRMLRPDGSVIWLEKRAQAFFDDNGKLLRTIGVVADVTDRKRAEQALRESEERFRLVANTAPVMIWMSGQDRLCNYFNQPWLEFTGRTLEAELGNGWAEGVHPEDLRSCLKTYTQAFDQRKPFTMQYRLRRRDGEFRWVSDIGVPRFEADGSFAGYIGSCVDITERKLAEEAFAKMGRRLIEAHEEERVWIARELHDDINQRIALLAIELGRANEQVERAGTDVHRNIQHACQGLLGIAQDVQALSHRLHSSKLEYLGIAVAAKSFCKELSAQYKVQVDFTYSNIPHSVPKEVSLSLFRVLQQALQNAVKHSGARHFRVELVGTPEELCLTVADSGVGFDWQAAINQQGLGLISMRERIQLVQGEFTIDSAPGHGTTIRARVPVRSEERLSAAG